MTLPTSTPPKDPTKSKAPARSPTSFEDMSAMTDQHQIEAVQEARAPRLAREAPAAIQGEPGSGLADLGKPIDPATVGTVEDMAALLRRHGIDPELYGKGEAKSLASLVKEVQNGEAQLVENDGKLVRSIRVLSMDISVERDGQTLHLYEDRQEFRDGRVRRRNLPASLAEKLHLGEAPEDSIARALEEEIGAKNFTIDGPIETATTAKLSPSYPGIQTEYHTYNAKVQLHPDEYRPEYREDQAEKSNIMLWRHEPAWFGSGLADSLEHIGLALHARAALKSGR